MHQVDPNLTRRKGRLAALAIAAMASASLVTVAVPATANADPEPAPRYPQRPPRRRRPLQRHPHRRHLLPPPPAAANTPNAQPGDPNAAPPPADPNAPPPPVIAPNAPQPVRIDNPVGGFSFALPAGWVESDAAHLDYGSALLSKTTGDPPFPGQPPPVATTPVSCSAG